jgi:hypothetical protein
MSDLSEAEGIPLSPPTHNPSVPTMQLFSPAHLTSGQFLVITIRSYRTSLGVCLFGGDSASRG